MNLTEIAIAVFTSVAVQGFILFWLKERLKLSIKHEYDASLENVKSRLEFELHQKTKLYEGKLANYKAYLKLFDEYSKENRNETFGKLVANLSKMMRYQSDVTVAGYVDEILAVQLRASEQFFQFKFEVNGLRLEAGDRLLVLLDRYVEALDKQYESVAAMLRELNSVALSVNGEYDRALEVINDYLCKAKGNLESDPVRLQNEIFHEMRRELSVT